LPLLAAAAFHGESVGADGAGLDIRNHYGDGMNLYQFVGSNPILQSDLLGLSWNDPFEEADEIINDINAAHVGAIEAVGTLVGTGINTAVLFAQLSVSLLPGADVLALAGKLISGAEVGWEDIAGAALSVGGGAILGKAASKLYGYLRRYGERGGDALRAAGKQISLVVLQRLCFSAGTLVWMADGSLKAIEEIRPRDMVMCDLDPEKANGAESCVVESVFARITPLIAELWISSDGTESTITATPEHPFYAEELDAYVPAKHLSRRGCLRAESGSEVRFEGSAYRAGEVPVYNIEVAVGHNYFVSQEKVLVHNTCKVLQTGGHTIREATAKALGLTRDQARRAMEKLKNDIGRKSGDHGHKIYENGNVVDSNTGEFLANLFDYVD
jgi:hypothetical protein